MLGAVFAMLAAIGAVLEVRTDSAEPIASRVPDAYPVRPVAEGRALPCPDSAASCAAHRPNGPDSHAALLRWNRMRALSGHDPAAAAGCGAAGGLHLPHHGPDEAGHFVRFPAVPVRVRAGCVDG